MWFSSCPRRWSFCEFRFVCEVFRTELDVFTAFNGLCLPSPPLFAFLSASSTFSNLEGKLCSALIHGPLSVTSVKHKNKQP